MTRIPCLSVRQPWASLIAAGIKDVENRSWCPDYRGPLLIHASATEVGWGIRRRARLRNERAPNGQTFESLLGPQWILLPPLQSILCLVTLYDIVGDSLSPWAVDGAYHWLLRDPKPLPTPIHGHGKLRLWYPPEEVVRCALQQLSSAS